MDFDQKEKKNDVILGQLTSHRWILTEGSYWQRF